MNITIDLLSLMEEIRKKYPLQGDYEEDARYNWPDRWEALYEAAKQGVSKTPCYACGGKGIIYADGIAVNCVCNPISKADQYEAYCICEKCWSDAYLRSLGIGKTQYACYLELLDERKDNPCPQDTAK